MSFRSLLDEFKLRASNTRDNVNITPKRAPEHQRQQNIPQEEFATGSDNLNLKRKRNNEDDIMKAKLNKVVKLPNDARDLTINLSFLCIGAQKSATSWLHNILDLHKSINVPKQKELHFWDWNR